MLVTVRLSRVDAEPGVLHTGLVAVPAEREDVLNEVGVWRAGV